MVACKIKDTADVSKLQIKIQIFCKVLKIISHPQKSFEVLKLSFAAIMLKVKTSIFYDFD